MVQILATMPALLATPNQGGQGPGPQAFLNLRGIGAARNLVMVDGHRISPTNGGGAVDSNLIPSLLVDRVDVVTGGASAVYGSDAVSGVVNYIMNNHLDGVKFKAQTGESTYNDDKTVDVGIAFGTSLFDGKGHIEGSYELSDDPGVKNRMARNWGAELWSTQGTGTAANPYQLWSNTRLATTTFGGLIRSGPLAGLTFGPTGTLTPFVNGLPTNVSTVQIGGSGAYYTDVYAFDGQNLNHAFGRFDYDFDNGMKAYAEVAFGSAFYWYSANNNALNNFQIGNNNAFLNNPAIYAQVPSVTNPYNAASTTSFGFNRIFTGDQLPAPMINNRENQILGLVGLTGKMGDYKWDVGFEHSYSTSLTDQPNNIATGRFYAALNAVVNGSGQIVCAAAAVNPLYANCVPFNAFGTNHDNSAAWAYINQDTRNTTHNTMDDVTASLTGAPFNDWAGPVNMALSGEFRRLAYSVSSDFQPLDPVSCAGIQFNCVTPTTTTPGTAPYVNGSTTNFPQVTENVKEFAYEAEVPLLKEITAAKALDLNAAARYTDYSTSGTVWSWKAGAVWQIDDAVSLRVGRSRDIRAPTLANLFAPLAIGFTNFQNQVTGVITPSMPDHSQGNPDLQPEKADTWTYGLVWQPRFVDGFSVSLDGYRIKIAQGLNGTGTRQPGTQASCINSGFTAPSCALYYPNIQNPIYIIDLTTNVGGFLTYGLDTEINYQHRIFGRAFSARVLFNYQPHLIYDQGVGGIADVGGAADGVGGLPATPSLKGLLQANLEVIPRVTLTVAERFRGVLTQNGNTSLQFAFGDQPPTWYTDVNLSYRPDVTKGKLETYLNIRNFFNKQPDPWASSGGGGQIGSFGGWLQGDDPMGRYMTVGVRYSP